jgi:hypothetical protein
MDRAAAARASGLFRFDDNLNPRQVLGQQAPPGAPLFRAGLGRGNCLFQIFQSQVELVGIELLRTPAEVHALQLAKQLAQSVALTSELIAFFDEPRLLGPFGVALGPRCQHQRAQRCDAAMSSGRISGLTTGIIASRQSRVSAQPTGESKGRRSSHQGNRGVTPDR